MTFLDKIDKLNVSIAINKEAIEQKMTKAMQPVILVVAMVVVVMAGSVVSAQSYNAGQNSGQTTIQSSLVGTRYTWTVFNISNQTYPSWDVLVWSLKPFNIKSPLSVNFPTGWTWTGTDFEVSESSKYFTPPAVAPGQSITFGYTFDPSGPVINQDSSVPGGGLGFLNHVGVVIPGSGNLSGTTQWGPTNGNFGAGNLSTFCTTPAPVADTSTLNLTGFGAFGLLGLYFRHKNKKAR